MLLKTLRKMRCRMLTWGTHDLILPIIRVLKTLPEFPYSVTELRNMPCGTLGKELLNFLEARNLDLLKDYESHDLKHVLFSYDADEEGEAAMQYFFLGNGARSFPVLITVAVTWLIIPEHHESFRRAYKRGKHTPALGGTNWYALLPQQISDIKNQLQIPS